YRRHPPFLSLCPGPTMDADRNLMFGVLALRLELLDRSRFVDACTAWARQSDVSLADFLVQAGWLTGEARNEVERILNLEPRQTENGTGEGACVPDTIAGEVLDRLTPPLHDPRTLPAPELSAPDELLPQVPGYEILEVLGRGAM